MKQKVRMTVNGAPVEREIEPRTLLVHFLREDLSLTGTNVGCETSLCGACTVLIDGVPRLSCITLAASVAGRHVETIENLARGGRMSRLQQAFHEKLGTQCGFCTPGMIMSAEGLLRRNAAPTEAEIRDALGGNLCRCTGYVKIIESVQSACAAATEA